MRCAIYCRLSREDENKADESESIQNQRLLLHQYAEDHGWTVCAEYIDDDKSGADLDRPGFRAMLRDAEAGKFDILLCKTQSRFTRDLEVSEHYLHRRFSEWGVRFISVVDGVDTGKRDNLKARQLGGLINEWYIADLSDNVRAVFDAKRRRGDFIGSFAPYGYKKSQTKKGRLEPDPEAAAVVREIFRLAGEGHSCAEIARLLTARAIPNPTTYKQLCGEKYHNGHPVRTASSRESGKTPAGAAVPGTADLSTQAVREGTEQNDKLGANDSTTHQGNCQTGQKGESGGQNPPGGQYIPAGNPEPAESESQIATASPPAQTCSAGWSRSTVSRILRNECYLGAVVQGKREKVSYKSKRLRERKRSEWIVVYGVNEPIVTREEFERAQKNGRK